MKFPKLKISKPHKPTKKQVKHFLVYALIVVAGNALAASGATFFINAQDFVMGGTTGIGIFVRKLLGGKNAWLVPFTVYIANIFLFLLGACLLGKKFALATFAGTLLYPSFMSLFTAINEAYMSSHDGIGLVGDIDPFLAAVMGALLFGAGIGVVVRVGASTGGTDIPPLILHKYFNIPVSASLWVLDIVIVFIQFFAGADVPMVLYGVIITLISSFVIDIVSPIGTKKTQVMIVSKKYRELREMILNTMNRGVTMLYGKTGFLKERCFVLLTVVSNRDVVRMKREVEKIDPEAFLMISVISEVRGRGFSSDQVALPKSAEGMDLTEVTEEELN